MASHPSFELCISDECAAERVASLLSHMCRINDVARDQGLCGVSRFHAVCPARVSIFNYVLRLLYYGRCEPSNLVVALMYLDTAFKKTQLTVDSLSVHRLILTATMIAAKYLNDIPMKNSGFASLGGVRVPELNQLEAKLLHCLEFDLYVCPQHFETYAKAVFKSALNNGIKKTPAVTLDSPTLSKHSAVSDLSDISLASWESESGA